MVDIAGSYLAGDLRAAAHPHRQRRRRTGVRGLWRHLHSRLAFLAVECRRRSARPMGFHRRDDLLGRSRVDSFRARADNMTKDKQ